MAGCSQVNAKQLYLFDFVVALQISLGNKAVQSLESNKLT